jgi:hypothetical protein
VDVNRRAARRRRPGRALGALGLLPVVAAAVLALTGCDPLQAGSAAVVGSTRITENQVDKDASTVDATLRKIGGQVPGTAALLRAEIEFRVDAQLVSIAAGRQGITITQGEIDALIVQSGGRSQLQKQLVAQDTLWLPPPQLDALAREFLQQQQLQQQLAPGQSTNAQAAALNAYITKVADEVGVVVSPRYGSWDVKTLTVAAGANDLSVPAGGTAGASAAPSPSASSTG